jgi:hypothetical protein
VGFSFLGSTGTVLFNATYVIRTNMTTATWNPISLRHQVLSFTVRIAWTVVIWTQHSTNQKQAKLHFRCSLGKSHHLLLCSVAISSKYTAHKTLLLRRKFVWSLRPQASVVSRALGNQSRWTHNSNVNSCHFSYLIYFDTSSLTSSTVSQYLPCNYYHAQWQKIIAISSHAIKMTPHPSPAQINANYSRSSIKKWKTLGKIFFVVSICQIVRHYEFLLSCEYRSVLLLSMSKSLLYRLVFFFFEKEKKTKRAYFTTRLEWNLIFELTDCRWCSIWSFSLMKMREIMTREVQLINSNHCLKEKKKRERKHRMTLTCLDSRFIYLLSTDCFFFSRHFCQNDILHFVCFVLYCTFFDWLYLLQNTNKQKHKAFLFATEYHPSMEI